VVFDKTCQNTFDAVRLWIQDLNETLSTEQQLPIVLLANKCDLQDPEPVFREEMDNFVKVKKTEEEKLGHHPCLQAIKILMHERVM
jgi:GTPase SAR1 family protein